MPGATHLAASKDLADMLHSQASSGKFYGAICASPAIVLAPLGLLDGKLATAYPGFETKLPNQTAAAQKVVVDGNCITAQSPGVAMDFALQIVGCMLGAVKSQEIRVDLAA
jgi:4-methyl-5(b-hydroxyethyl)-thiazole monophosphate biosynthesis